MSYKPRTLFSLIEDIDNRSLFLPHIQRAFVWERDQMVRLFDSLMRNYPIQTLLFWRTKDYVKARRFMPSIEWDADLSDYYDQQRSNAGVQKVFVLDGQQRLQSLYALFNGSVKSNDGKADLDAYVDLTSGVDVDKEGLAHRLQFATASPGPEHYRLRDLLGVDAQKNSEELADKLNERLDDALQQEREVARNRQRRVRANCGQMISLLRHDSHFWVEELDGVANHYPYKKILDIFVRVNSGGTKLNASDLMFAAMKSQWASIEQNVEEIVDLLNAGRLDFDKSFVLRCLVVCNGKGAASSPELFTSAEGESLLDTIEANWSRAEATFQELRDFITNDLKLYGDKVVRSYSSFIPLFDYLYHNPKPNEANRVLMRGYYYKSQLFNWYASQTEDVVNALHARVGKVLPDGFPMTGIKEYFANSRKAATELKQADLSNTQLRFIILNLVYVSRFGASPFNVCFKGNEPHLDHIYPQSALKKEFDLPTAEINHIGNYRFVGATDNIRKRAECPADFFGRLKKQSVDIANHLLVPEFADDPAKLKFDAATYHRFRDHRTAAIFEIADKVVNPETQEEE